MFQSIILENNHRQGKDKSYADILNRIRVGVKLDEDMKVGGGISEQNIKYQDCWFQMIKYIKILRIQID